MKVHPAICMKTKERDFSCWKERRKYDLAGTGKDILAPESWLLNPVS